MTLAYETMAPEGVPAPAARAITRLMLTDFRSYAQAELKAEGRSVALIGPNGAGKTNVLEAISALSPGRGLRMAQLAEMGRTELGAQPRPWAVSAAIRDETGEMRIGTGLVPAGDGAEKRVFRLNGAPVANAQEIAEIIRVLWLTPAMDRLFVEGASGRRRFLDRIVLILDPAHVARTNAYERAMRERLSLLRQGRADPLWLDGLERQMAERGVAIAAARKEAVARLAAVMAERTGAFPSAELALACEVGEVLETRSAIETEDWLAGLLHQGRARDAEAGRTQSGPHRADLKVTHRLKARAAEECSTGEQKALLIAIVLGAARLQGEVAGGTAPILLLDEIAAHLDAIRRAALFEELAVLGTQTWMTGTDGALFAGLRGRAEVFTVAAGRFVPLELKGD